MIYFITLSINGNKITIHTHAPFGLQDIKNLGKLLGVNLEFSDQDLTKLGQYIDQINIKFQGRIKKNTVWQICEDKGANFNGDLSDFPYLKLIWNRYYAENLDRSIQRNGNFFEWVHGHDMDGPPANNVIVLDNILGKGENLVKAEYNVFISIEPNFAKTHQFVLPHALEVNQEKNNVSNFNAKQIHPFRFETANIHTNIHTLFKCISKTPLSKKNVNLSKNEALDENAMVNFNFDYKNGN